MPKLPEFSSELAHAVSLEATHAALLARKFLDHLESQQSSPRTIYPQPYLLGLGGCLRFIEWQVAGLLELLPAEAVNSMMIVIRNFLDCIENTACRECDLIAPAIQVFATWTRCFAWHAREELGIDMVLRVNADSIGAFEDELASLLTNTTL